MAQQTAKRFKAFPYNKAVAKLNGINTPQGTADRQDLKALRKVREQRDRRDAGQAK
jgi:hypothetical protein